MVIRFCRPMNEKSVPNSFKKSYICVIMADSKSFSENASGNPSMSKK